MEKLLEMLKYKKGRIISSASLSEFEISRKKSNGEFYIDENGFGFAWIPENYDVVNGVCLKRNGLMNNDEFLQWWSEKSKIIEENMIQFDIEQKKQVALAFQELSKIIIRL